MRRPLRPPLAGHRPGPLARVRARDRRRLRGHQARLGADQLQLLPQRAGLRVRRPRGRAGRRPRPQARAALPLRPDDRPLAAPRRSGRAAAAADAPVLRRRRRAHLPARGTTPPPSPRWPATSPRRWRCSTRCPRSPARRGRRPGERGLRAAAVVRPAGGVPGARRWSPFDLACGRPHGRCPNVSYKRDSRRQQLLQVRPDQRAQRGVGLGVAAVHQVRGRPAASRRAARPGARRAGG